MTRALIIVVLGGLLGAAGCSHTVKAVEKDTHQDVQWVGHRF